MYDTSTLHAIPLKFGFDIDLIKNGRFIVDLLNVNC